MSPARVYPRPVRLGYAATALLITVVAAGSVVVSAQSTGAVTETVSAAVADTVVAADYDVAPRLQQGKYPLFPRSHVRAGKKASALIEYTVSAEGRAESVRVLETDDPKFSGHIAAVIRQSRFKPGLKDGKPVRATVRVQFDLN